MDRLLRLAVLKEFEKSSGMVGCWRGVWGEKTQNKYEFAKNDTKFCRFEICGWE